MNYKYCSNCGRKIKASTKFCPYCGTKQPVQNKRNTNNSKNKRYKLVKQKESLNRSHKSKHSLYVKKGHVSKKQFLGTIIGLIIAFFLIFACTKIYQIHHHHVKLDQATATFKGDINNDTNWKIGSGKFSDDSTDVHIMMSSDTYDISGNEIRDISNDDSNDDSSNQYGSYHVNNGVLYMTDLMASVNNDDTFDNNSNVNQFMQHSSDGNTVKGTIDINKDDKDLVRGALKTESDSNFVLFRSRTHPSQFILFQRQ